ncbi:MAG: hypothetical protein ACOZIN_15770, partial [Myxococcota bacterium]
ATELSFAGSLQLDYKTLPARKSPQDALLNNFTAEAGFKVSATVSEHLQVSAKMCFGCHQFEAAYAQVDFNITDEANIRAGRIQVPFGDFYQRHDPANHKTSSKPIIYDMGHMVRPDAYNFGVFPIPLPDNGLEFFGTHFFGESVYTSYSLFAVNGLKGNARTGEFNWKEARQPQLVDTDRLPTLGVRWSGGVSDLSSTLLDVTLGASAMAGTYDKTSSARYALVGGHLSMRFAHRVVLRGEYAMRMTEFSQEALADPLAFQQTPVSSHYLKHGGYVELEVPLTGDFEAIVRGDAMWRQGVVPLSVPLGPEARVYRGTAGVLWITKRFLRWKLNYEYWWFSDFAPEHLAHLSAVTFF